MSAAAGLPPETTALVKAIAAGVLFVRVTVMVGGVAVPICTVPKLKLVGETTNVGMSESFAIKPSEGPSRVVWNAVGAAVGNTGILAAWVWPMMYAFGGFAESIAIPQP